MYEKVLAIIKQRLRDNDYTIIEEKSIQYGLQIKLLGGANINIYSTGKFIIQGAKDNSLEILLR